MLCKYFQEVKCFKDLDIRKNDMLRIVHSIECIYVPKQEFLFRVGDRGQTFFVCLSGKCQLFIVNPELNALKNQRNAIRASLEDANDELEELKAQKLDTLQVNMRI